MTHPPDHSAYSLGPSTPEEWAEHEASKKRQAAFPNVGLEDGQDIWVHQYGIRNKKTGDVFIIDNELYREFNPYRNKCPEGYEIVSRTLYPLPWTEVNW